MARFTQVDYVDRVAFILTVGDQMIAVGRYDRTEGDEAEVAFLVEDAHQGRGIAQLLLEHLAEAARERGIVRFYAELLPQNAPDGVGVRRRGIPGVQGDRGRRAASWSSRSCRPTPRSG